MDELGIDDFGIYNLVGSLIATVAMLKGMFSSSTQRFLNFEMGKGNQEKLKTIFNMSIYINSIIAIIFFIVVEIIGIWFFEYKINISPDRLLAAKVVFHLSVLSSVVTIVMSPFDSVIIANEKMKIYALISIFEGIFRLIILFSIQLFTGDKLIFYSVLILLLTLIISIINLIYCKNNFYETHFKLIWDKIIFKEMFSFAGWQLLGNSAYTLTNNGINMLLNIFGGPAINAARGISYQINSAIGQFVSNIILVTNPFSVKSYAEGKNEQMFRMTYFSSKLLFIVHICLITPIMFLTEDILKLWLKTVPEYSTMFIQIILIWSLIRTLHSPIDTLFLASGKIKKYQLIEGIILSLPLLASYFALQNNLTVYSVFYFMVIFEILNLFFIVNLAKRIVKLNITEYLNSVIIPCIICLSVAIFFFITIKYYFSNSLQILFLSIIVSIICLLVMFNVGFNKMERQKIISLILNQINL